MKSIVTVFFAVLSSRIAHAEELKSLTCKSQSTGQSIVSIRIDTNGRLLNFQDLVLGKKLDQIQNNKSLNARSDVQFDSYGTQSVMLKETQSEIHFLNINFRENHHFITIYGKSAREYTQIIGLNCGP